MRRDQLEHAIRTACQIIERSEVIVVGSQAILGTLREDELPRRATMSGEIDILPIAEGNEETAQLADRIEGVAAGGAAFRTSSPASWCADPDVLDARRPAPLSKRSAPPSRPTGSLPSARTGYQAALPDPE